MRLAIVACACLVGIPLWAREFGEVSGWARAYFESAYLSSGGSLTYTKPVAEQYGAMWLSLGDYGSIGVDAWLCSALNDQTDHLHRRAFYICEDTVLYRYDWRFSEEVVLSTSAGPLWDFLFGYKVPTTCPTYWYVSQYLDNPYVVPYMTALGKVDRETRARVRVGLRRPFRIMESVSVSPFVDATWGDEARFISNYGAEPNQGFLGGAVMFTTFGLIAEWRFAEHFFLWGRYRQYILIDSYARELVSKKDSPTAKVDCPIFGLGLGCSF